MDRLPALLPWAFTAGAVATLNPCGFAMLPAYLSYYIAGTSARMPVHRSVRRALGVGLAMTGGVLVIFLVAGGVVSIVGTGVARALPAANLAIGVVVGGLGLLLLLRPQVSLGSPVGNPLASRPAMIEGQSVRAFAVFGAGYGIASLGCTLPIFLVVMTQALAAGGILPGLAVFAAYGVGMGAVLLALALAVGTGQGVLVGSLRRFVPHVERVGALGMVAAGSYLVYYQVTIGRVLLLGP